VDERQGRMKGEIKEKGEVGEKGRVREPYGGKRKGITFSWRAV